MKGFVFKKYNSLQFLILIVICVIFLNLGLWQHAHGGAQYQISGFYLGATPEEVSVQLAIDPGEEEKYYEVEASGILLFFIKMDEKLRLYRIVQEQPLKPDKVRSVLDNLKAKYGTPDKQQIKTSSIRPKRGTNYTTMVKNKAIWKISESQEFIAEIESQRVVYELLDRDPENIKSPEKNGEPEGGESGSEKWNPDY